MDSKKIRVGVIFDATIDLGGGFQHQLSSIIELNNSKKFELIFLVLDKKNKEYLKKSYNIEANFVKFNIFDYLFMLLSLQKWFWMLVIMIFKIRSHFEKKLEKYDLDILYFLRPSGVLFNITSHNFILNVFDLAHRDFPEFPEVNFYKEFEKRELFYETILKKAVAIITDSEDGKVNIVKRYNIEPSRIYVVSYKPSYAITLKKKECNVFEKYNIPGDYIFYPAQFWAHKNHVYITEALAILKQMGIEIFAVFSGSDKGNLKHVLEFAKVIGVQDFVKYIGFAPEEDMFSLYKNAFALVMPSYFGPTNIPPLEAFAVGIPVIYSDLPSFREQVKDAALFCDLKDPMSLVNHLINLKQNKELRNILIENGKKRLEELTEVKVSKLLEEILNEYFIKLKCWKV